VASVIAEDEHYAENTGGTADNRVADFKPAAPHPLEGGSLDPTVGEPPSGA
jgi:hypothetical protein